MASTFQISAPPSQQPSIQTEGSKCQIVTITYLAASTYATGGDAFTPAQLGFGANGVIDRVFPIARANSLSATTDVVAGWDYTNGKLQLFGGAASGVPLAELTAATAVAGLKVDLMVFGTGI